MGGGHLVLVGSFAETEQKIETEKNSSKLPKQSRRENNCLASCPACSSLYPNAGADQHGVMIQPLLSEGSGIFGELQNFRNIQN